MLKLEGAAVFVAVAEAGSISEAARRLGLPKSVVSERLAELERALGARLAHRTTRRLTLTEDGAAFLGRARLIVREAHAAMDEMAERRAELSGPLRLAGPVSFGALHLGPALYRFLAEHPGVELSLDLDDRFVDIAAGGYDAVVRHGPVADSRLVAHRLTSSRRLLVASPAYLAAHGEPHTVDQLRSHRAILYANREADWSFPGPTGAVVVRAPVALRVNNGLVMRDAAAAGLGVALLTRFIAHRELATGALKAIDVGLEPEGAEIFLAHPRGLGPSAKVRALVRHLRESFGDPAYWDVG